MLDPGGQAVEDLDEERFDQKHARRVFGEAALTHIKERVVVERTGRRPMRAFDVIGVDLKLGLVVRFRHVGEEERAGVHLRVGFLAPARDEELALKDAARAVFQRRAMNLPRLAAHRVEGDEARLIGDYIIAPDEAKAAHLMQRFAGLHTPGFTPARDLQRIAVVNQTTLLMNETAAIIDHFKAALIARYGEAEGALRVGGAGKKDTLCYATQVNQDALQRALAEPLDAAFIIGGKNSSNTYQLYRLCEQKLGPRAFFIQSEANIRSRDEIEHYVFPAAGHGHGGHTEVHPLWPGDDTAKRVLITGGASCPDGLVQQVITRINSFFPPERLRSAEAVLTELTGQ